MLNSASKKITISRIGSGEYIEKKSIFTGTAAPVSSKDEAEAFVASVKAKYPDARHNVFAYNVGDNGTARYSDDGEPQGTGGIPVLDVLRKSGITDAAIVVTRYFGGILLGAPGLVRAYTAAATSAVKDAGIITLEPYTECLLTADYSTYTRIENELDKFAVKRDDISFGEKVILRLALRNEVYQAFNARIIEITAGRCRPETTGSRYDG